MIFKIEQLTRLLMYTIRTNRTAFGNLPKPILDNFTHIWPSLNFLQFRNLCCWSGWYQNTQIQHLRRSSENGIKNVSQWRRYSQLFIYLFHSKRIDVNVFKDTPILSVSFIVVMKVQISDDMKNALLEYGNKYLITERGEIEVYVSIMFTWSKIPKGTFVVTHYRQPNSVINC